MLRNVEVLKIAHACAMCLREFYDSRLAVCCDAQLFMAVLWTIHELLTTVMYWNLPALQLQEQLETLEANYENTPPPVNVTETQPLAVDREIVSGDCTVSPVMLFIPQQPVCVTPSAALQRADQRRSSAEQRLDVSDTLSETMSNEFIEEAEEFMHTAPESSSVVAKTSAAAESSVFDASAIRNLSWPCDAVSPLSRTNSDSFLQCRRQFYGSVKRGEIGSSVGGPYDGQIDGATGAPGASSATHAEVSQIVHETSTAPAEPELPSSSLPWRYYYDGQYTGHII